MVTASRRSILLADAWISRYPKRPTSVQHRRVNNYSIDYMNNTTQRYFEKRLRSVPTYVLLVCNSRLQPRLILSFPFFFITFALPPPPSPLSPSVSREQKVPPMGRLCKRASRNFLHPALLLRAALQLLHPNLPLRVHELRAVPSSLVHEPGTACPIKRE